MERKISLQKQAAAKLRKNKKKRQRKKKQPTNFPLRQMYLITKPMSFSLYSLSDIKNNYQCFLASLTLYSIVFKQLSFDTYIGHPQYLQ